MKFWVLTIKIQNSRLYSKFYNKRDNFNFDITRVPYKLSNIPHVLISDVGRNTPNMQSNN